MAMSKGGPDKDDERDHRPYCIATNYVVQEWDGSAWSIVDNSHGHGRPPRPLDPKINPGEYAGQRVRTPCE